MFLSTVGGGGVGGSTPLLGGRRLPEVVQRGVAIKVDDDHGAAARIVSQTVLVSEVGGTPGVTSLDPAQQPGQILAHVGPAGGYILRIAFVLTALMNCNFVLHYLGAYRGTSLLSQETYLQTDSSDQYQ